MSDWYSSKDAGVANFESTSDFFNVNFTRLFSGSIAKTYQGFYVRKRNLVVNS